MNKENREYDWHTCYIQGNKNWYCFGINPDYVYFRFIKTIISNYETK